jgi:hypothetical protein
MSAPAIFKAAGSNSAFDTTSRFIKYDEPALFPRRFFDIFVLSAMSWMCDD